MLKIYHLYTFRDKYEDDKDLNMTYIKDTSWNPRYLYTHNMSSG